MRGAPGAAHHAGAGGVRGDHRLGTAADFAYRSALSHAARWHTDSGLHPARVLRLRERRGAIDGGEAPANAATAGSGGGVLETTAGKKGSCTGATGGAWLREHVHGGRA